MATTLSLRIEKQRTPSFSLPPPEGVQSETWSSDLPFPWRTCVFLASFFQMICPWLRFFPLPDKTLSHSGTSDSFRSVKTKGGVFVEAEGDKEGASFWSDAGLSLMEVAGGIVFLPCREFPYVVLFDGHYALNFPATFRFNGWDGCPPLPSSRHAAQAGDGGPVLQPPLLRFFFSRPDTTFPQSTYISVHPPSFFESISAYGRRRVVPSASSQESAAAFLFFLHRRLSVEALPSHQNRHTRSTHGPGGVR